MDEDPHQEGDNTMVCSLPDTVHPDVALRTDSKKEAPDQLAYGVMKVLCFQQ